MRCWSCTGGARRSGWWARGSTSRPAIGRRRRARGGGGGGGINGETGDGGGGGSHIGGGIDSYYEYLLKGALLFGDDELREAYDDSINAVNRFVADESAGGL